MRTRKPKTPPISFAYPVLEFRRSHEGLTRTAHVTPQRNTEKTFVEGRKSQVEYVDNNS